MKKVLSTIVLVCALLVPGVVSAQAQVPGATPVQAFQPMYACDQAFTATAAGNATTTATAPAQPGKVFYFCSVDIALIANAAVTGAAGPALACTTSNLINNLIWWGTNETLGTGAMRAVTNLSFGVVPLKSLVAGTATTIACSGGQSTYNVRVNITGFYGTP